MIYTVLNYDSRTNMHTIRDEKSQCFRVNLCVDASWDRYVKLTKTCDNNKDIERLCISILGRKIEIEELIPLSYFAKNTKTN